MSKSKICLAPFRCLQLGTAMYATCCPGFVDKEHHVLIHSSPTLGSDMVGVWHHPNFVSLREKILNDDYSSCQNCPRVREGLKHFTDKQKVQTQLVLRPDGPQQMSLANDHACQLRCGTCRQGVCLTPPKQVEIRTHNSISIIKDSLATLELIEMSGNGDPFISEVYKNVFDWLEERIDQYPKLKIRIRTNGLLLPRAWNQWPKTMARVVSIIISIDAASKDTYERVRPPAKWGQLIRAMEFVRDLIAENPKIIFSTVFVVQTDNFHEMGDFVDFVKQYGCRTIQYHRLLPMQQTDIGILYRSVHLKGHPRHEEYLRAVQDPRLSDPIVIRPPSVWQNE